MKKRTDTLAYLLGLACTAAFLHCAPMKPEAGNSSQTGNPALAGVVYNQDGSRAKNAKVCIARWNASPQDSNVIADSTVTNDTGGYKIDTLAADTFNLLASSGVYLGYEDSIKVKSDSTTIAPPCTLRAKGSVSGVVQLENNGNATTVFILFMGTNTFVTPHDSIGNFTASNLAEGRYTVKIITTLPNYVPLDTSFTVTAGVDSVLPDTLRLHYTGIPIPQGLRIEYDTMKQIVTLIWNKPTTGTMVQGYNIYRKHQDSAGFEKIKSGVTDTVFPDSTLKNSGTYEYRVTAVDTQYSEGVLSAGVTVNFQSLFRMATDAVPYGLRAEHSSVVFDNKLWVIAGWTQTMGLNPLKKDVWYTSDGMNWSLATDSAAFPERRGHSSVVFNGKMWVIGGNSYDRGKLNDIWNSSDGVTWTKVADSTSFSRRSWHASVVFDNKMWVIGGRDNNVALNDVWYSSDGITWTAATNSAEFSPRAGHATVVFKGMIWVIGGTDGLDNKNDIWNSSDGISWTLVTSAADFTGRYGLAVVATDSAMCVIGGAARISGTTYAYNDFWYSANGTSWSKLNAPSQFAARYNHTALFLNNRIYVIGGYSDTIAKDVWYVEWK